MKIEVYNSYIIINLLKTKQIYTRELFITDNELEIFKSIYKNKLKKESIFLNIIDDSKNDLFIRHDCYILLNPKCNYHVDDLLNNYDQSKIDDKINNLITNYDLNYSYLNQIRENNNALKFYPTDLNKIINKIIFNSDLFYKRIAKELNADEYNFLEDLIEHKSCNNCQYLNHSCQMEKCNYWKNDVLVGKLKVLK